MGSHKLQGVMTFIVTQLMLFTKACVEPISMHQGGAALRIYVYTLTCLILYIHVCYIEMCAGDIYVPLLYVCNTLVYTYTYSLLT